MRAARASPRGSPVGRFASIAKPYPHGHATEGGELTIGRNQPLPPIPLYPDLAGKVVVVTGGSRGIGAATCEAFAANRARVAVCGRDKTAISEVVERACRAGGEASGFTADCTRASQLEELREEIEATLGPPDVVVAFAGGFVNRTPLLSTVLANWEQVICDNLTSTFLTITTFAPRMVSRGKGAVVTMASYAGRHLDVPLTASYAAAKAGVVQLSRHAALELAGDGVRVNCVAPATTSTERVEGVWDEESRSRLAQGSPLGRLGLPSDTAFATLYLSSESAGWITGVTLDVAGGRVMM